MIVVRYRVVKSEIMSDLIVVKANSLIEASYRLSIDEIRILALTIGTMNPKSNQQIFDFSVADVVREFPEMHIDSAYEKIKIAVKKLYDRSIRTEDENLVTDFRWVSSRTYFKKEGRFRIAMTNEVMPYLTQLKGQFTQYQLRNISSFNSVYTIRIYELCMQYKTLGEREISVDDLKKWLQIEDKYPRYNSFNQRVLEPAIKEINEKSDLFLEVESIKLGRAIVGIRFQINHKKKAAKAITNETKRPRFPHKNKYGKFVKFDANNPKKSSHEFGLYAYDCLKILDDFYADIAAVTLEDLRHYWIFLSVNSSHKSKLGKRSDFIAELAYRGYKLVAGELVRSS